MKLSEINQINTSLKTTKKAIISLGCSFAEGQGAFDVEIYKNYKVKYTEHGSPLELDVTEEERDEILAKFSNVDAFNGKLSFHQMERDNSFVNILCNKYFDGTYTPVNFGLRGRGNRASIKDLVLTHEINWDNAEEIVVVYCPSSLERFDFCADYDMDRPCFTTMWPHYENMDNVSRQKLWEGYALTVWSNRSEVIEQISNVQELSMWCKLHNAKLIITPGFDKRYDKEYFNSALHATISRDKNGNVTSAENPGLLKFSSGLPNHTLLKLFPWENKFEPDGFETFIELVLSQEPDVENKLDPYFQFLGKGSPNGWVTPCAHPSKKGHDLFAQHLHTFIVEGKARGIH